MPRRLLSLFVVVAVLATGLGATGGAVSAQPRRAGARTAAATPAGADIDLAGNWALTETWDGVPVDAGHIQTATYTFTETSLGIYSVSNGAGWTTTDVPISGSSFTLWTCGNGGSYSDQDKSACPCAAAIG